MEFLEIQYNEQNFKISNTQPLLSTWTLIRGLGVQYGKCRNG